MFILLVALSIGAALIWALAKTEKKLRGHIDRRVEELGEDEEIQQMLSVVVVRATTLVVLWRV